ncbi:hypothetical protein AB6D40_022635 [Vibrio cyclitrophicus]|jgi:hypothetical protein
MKKWLMGCVALMVTMFSTLAFASLGVPADDAPAWVYRALGVLAGVVSVVAQVDAQISEAFKRKWPWWLRVAWNLTAGNYRHSKNVAA